METLELKTNLVHAIENLEDKKVLEEVYRLLQITIEDDIFKLSDVQKDKIKIGKNQYQNGEFYSHEESEKIMQEWLKD